MDPYKCIQTEKKYYKPEFSLKVNSYCAYLQIPRSEWICAVKQSILENKACDELILIRKTKSSMNLSTNSANKLSNNDNFEKKI